MVKLNERFVAKPFTSLMLLFFLTNFFSCIIGFAVSILTPHFSNQQIAMRLMAIFQDLFVFIVPALLTACLATRLPAKLLALNYGTPWRGVFYIIAIALVSIPLMECVIEWNKSLSLPSSLDSIQQWMNDMESQADNATKILLGEKTIGNAVVSILLIGVLAGFSEELFFRGTVQRLLSQSPLGHHAAIWITAFVFSAVHLQFLGFVPRLLLGAYFGYLLYWGRSLWLPVIAHILNNTLAVSAYYLSDAQDTETAITGNSLYLVIASVAMTATGIYLCRRSISKSTNTQA